MEKFIKKMVKYSFYALVSAGIAFAFTYISANFGWYDFSRVDRLLLGFIFMLNFIKSND